jgi:hypothetical protein
MSVFATKRFADPAAVDYRRDKHHYNRYNPCDHPAPELLFAAVAALQHLTDVHDADNVSPPPIWPMVLHGAMPDLFIFDDEDDLLGWLRVCFAAIMAERRILTLVYIRSAQHILSRRPYHLYRDEKMFSVLLNLITQPVSSARLRHEAALLLSDLFPADEDVVINLAHVSLSSADGQLVETCREAMCRTLAHARVAWAGRQVSALQKLGGDDALMDQLYVDIVESASPSASALLLVLTVNFPMDTKYYETTLRRCLEQLATQPASWQPVHLWFMYAVLATVRPALKNIVTESVPFAALAALLERDVEYAQPAFCILDLLLLWKHPLPVDLIARLPQFLAHDDPMMRISALLMIHSAELARDATFFVERILPFIHEFIEYGSPATETSMVRRLTRCPEVLVHTMDPYFGGSRRVSIDAMSCIMQAFAALPERSAAKFIVSALLESPSFAALLAVAASAPKDVAARTQALEVIAEAVWIAGYDAVALAAGPERWRPLIDRVAELRTVTPNDMILATSMVEKESVETALRLLPVLVAPGVSLGGYWDDNMRPNISLQLVTKVLQCCAVEDADERYLDAGWNALRVMLLTHSDQVALAVQEHRQILEGALRHPAPTVQSAAFSFKDRLEPGAFGGSGGTAPCWGTAAQRTTASFGFGPSGGTAPQRTTASFGFGPSGGTAPQRTTASFGFSS